MRLSQRSVIALTTLAATASLGLSLLQPVATAAPRDKTAATTTVTERQAATNALDAVQSALGDAPQAQSEAPGLAQGEPGRDLTLLLAQLTAHLPDLSASDQRTARAILARPTSSGGDLGGTVEYNHSLAVQNDCGNTEPGAGTNFCVNWVNSSSDAPSTADSNGTADSDGIPDYVERVRSVVQNVWDTEVGSMGYKAPLNDGSVANHGPNNKIDIYLADLGSQSLYGYCVPEGSSDAWDLPGYCVVDNNYTEGVFSAHSPLENLQVTAAHEFFHAIQFAYDYAEDPWMMEGTAAWMEDEVYDNVNDNYQYLRSSPLSNPNRPLDHSASIGVYGSWVWWRFLSEWFDNPGVVRSIWNRADDSDNAIGDRYSLKAVEAELAARGTTLAKAFSLFGAVNRAPQTFYEEGAAYRNVQKTPAAKSFTLTKNAAGSGSKALTLNHMTNGTIAVKPGNGIGNAWTLKIDVDGPARSHKPFVTVASFADNGSVVDDRVLHLNRNGVGSLRIPFGNLGRVDVTLTNAGAAYRCWKGTQFACQGKPQDDNQKFVYKVTAKP